MIVDVVRQVAAWLADPTTGVNALRASVPKDAGDAAPAAVTLYTEADDPVTALGPIDETLLDAGPALCVCFVGTAGEELGPHTAGAVTPVSVLVRYAAHQAGATYARDGWQTLRAAARSLRKAATATRNRVVMDPPARVQYYAPPPGGEALNAFVPALLVTVPATDAWALGA